MVKEGVEMKKARELFNRGKWPETKVLLSRIVTDTSDNAEAWFALGVVNECLQDRGSAIHAYEQALVADAGYVDARFNLGNLLRVENRMAEAESCYRKVLARAPRHRGALLNLGGLLLAQEEWDEAGACFQRVLEQQPDDPLACTNLAHVCLQRELHEEAEKLLRRAIALRPDYAAAHANLGMVLKARGRLGEALPWLEQAAKLAPKSFPAHFALANAYQACGRADEAVTHYEAALRLDSAHFEAMANLAQLYFDEGETDKANALLAAMREQEIRPAETDALEAAFLEKSGRKEEALKLLQPQVEGGQVSVKAALVYGKLAGRSGQGDRAEKLLLDLLASSGIDAKHKPGIHFQLAHLYDQQGRFDEAFEQLRQANETKPAHFDREAHRQMLDFLKASFPGMLPASERTSDLPLFIVGMPRSGTSLLEQILDSHPAIAGAGELRDIGKTARTFMAGEPGQAVRASVAQMNALADAYLGLLSGVSSSARRVVDKAPGNFRYLGLIQQLLPGARVIHAMRDPMDTCLSCYFQNFKGVHDYAYDLADLGYYYQEYVKLMAHWKETLALPMLDVRYEDVVARPEEEARRVIAFCGLEWDDACLNFHENKRQVRTASYDQVRRPLYKSSVERWRNYEAHLDPLQKALAE